MDSGSQPARPLPVTGIPVGQQARWSSGLCDCCSDPLVVATCCPCITFGRIAEITDQGAPPCVRVEQFIV
uniref:Uncharacterized protein n=1 Tax=Salix viminalis TaxID=40686 RepID=A0A6N2MD60_SALVM